MGSEAVTHYPWMAGPWERLSAYVRTGHLPHALLISGRRGLGKRLLAKTFGQRLLCLGGPGEGACGRCAACRLAAADTHPDLVTIEPEEPGRSITVDAIRGMTGRLALKPHYGVYRVVIVVPAHQLNRYAANSLLKTLEEPDTQTVFVLVTDAPQNIAVTIRSRCHRLMVPTPPRHVVVEWLRQRNAGEEADALCSMALGGPLRALELLGTASARRRRDIFESWFAVGRGTEDPVAAAALWEQVATEDVVSWLCSWVEELIRLRLAPAAGIQHNPELQEPLRCLAGTLNLVQLFEYLDFVYRAQRSLSGQINRQLLMEELAIRWARLTLHP